MQHTKTNRYNPEAIACVNVAHVAKTMRNI